MLNLIARWRRDRATFRELSRLSDHQLADIGVARWDVASIVERATDQDPAPSKGTGSAAARRPEPRDSLAPSWASHNRRALAG